MGVALLRGVASTARAPFRGVHDPLAASLLPRPIGRLPALLGRAPTAARWLSGGLLDHVALRTAAIDDEVRTAIAERAGPRSGSRQLVILGAGLDARAYRMPELGSAVVFEVDHPATQAQKRERLGDRAPTARDVRFVAVDFAADDLDARLDEAGHDRRAPTIWIWEGVMPYLPIEAARATLAIVSARSAEGSTLLLTYLTPEHVRVPSRLLPIVQRAFAVLGEPLRTPLPTPTMHALLVAHELTPVRDTGSPDWARAHLRAARPVLEITERLVVSVRPTGAGA